MLNDELPVINDADEITQESHPEMYKELCEGCGEGGSANG